MTKTNSARSAVKAASKEAKGAPAKKTEASKHEETTATDDVKRFQWKLCKVTTGKRKDEVHGVYYVRAKSQFKKALALAEGKTADEPVVYLNPAQLEIVGDMAKADVDRISKAQQAQRDETLYIAAFAKSETDTGITLSYPGWARNLFFTKSNETREGMISLTGSETADGTKIFEIAAWKVKKDCGEDSYNALKGKQAELAKIVERPAK